MRDELGKRLKEERERLGLTQGELAEACGVGKTAQYTYEKGTREPSFSYLEAAEKLGMDVGYVMSGARKDDDWVYARAYKRLLYSLEMFLGLDEDRLEKITMLAVECDRMLDARRPTSYEPYNQAVLDWLSTSKNPERCMDLDLFAKTLAELEAVTARRGLVLPPDKKADATVMLYRAFKARNKIDEKMIDDTIRLAT